MDHCTPDEHARRTAEAMLAAHGIPARLLSSDELARFLPRKPAALRRAAEAGELPAYAIPHQARTVWMYDLAEVLQATRAAARRESLKVRGGIHQVA